MTVLALEGIRSTLRTAMTLFILEVAIVLLMAVIVMLSGGAHGITTAPLTPSASPNGFQGLVTGGVFAALSFVGFEGATTLGEEVRNPRRNVPLAIALSTLAVGLIYVFCIWAEVIGLGPDKVNALTGSSTPWNDLAALYAPWMTPLIIVASVSSMAAVMVNGNTGVVRILYAMGREKLLPSAFAYIDAKHGTPKNAVYFQSLFSALVVIVVGALSGGLANPDGGSNVYGYCGFLLTLAILLVYILANLAAISFFRRRGDARILRQMLLPALGALLITALFVAQIIEQTDPPFTWMVWMIIAWLVICIIGAGWLGMNRPEILSKAGAILAPED
jgi:amino acid transporter